MKTNTLRAGVLGLLLIGLLAVPTASRAQTVMNTLTNSVAITATNTQTFTVSSTTNVTTNAEIFWPATGEIMCVTAIPSSGTVTVRRGCEGTGAFTGLLAITSTGIIIPSGATTGSLGDLDMGGACTRGSGYAAYSPYINRRNAYMWVCINSLWQGATQRNITLNSLPPFTP